MSGHVLYETSDPTRPKEICDRNGEVVLACCKVCGRAESELDLYPFCDGETDLATANHQSKGPTK